MDSITRLAMAQREIEANRKLHLLEKLKGLRTRSVAKRILSATSASSRMKLSQQATIKEAAS